MNLEDAEGKEKEDAVFKCKTDDKEAPVQWFINGKPIKPSEKYVMSHDGFNHTLTIKNLQKGEDCEVSCTVGEQSSAAKLKVQGKYTSSFPSFAVFTLV